MPRRRKPKPYVSLRYAATSLNAVRHGALSETPVLPLVEREEDWLEHRKSIFDALEPGNGLEDNLAERAAVILWRMRRIIRYERESIIASQLAAPDDMILGERLVRKPPPDPSDPRVIEELEQMLLLRMVPDTDTLNKIMRYETRLHRHLLQTLHQFYLVKGLRRNTGQGVFDARTLDPPGMPGGPKPDKPTLPLELPSPEP